MPEDPSLRIGSRDPHAICVEVLREMWVGEAYPYEVVTWMFTALDEEGDTTIPRGPKDRKEAETMCSMVMADLGDGCDYGAVVSNVLRAACASLPPCSSCGHGRPTHVYDCPATASGQEERS